ncbi:unnamed protein product [Paramecium primaurelia]|nr:unnamed protein product [Paramecium primaurelia]
MNIINKLFLIIQLVILTFLNQKFRTIFNHKVAQQLKLIIKMCQIMKKLYLIFNHQKIHQLIILGCLTERFDQTINSLHTLVKFNQLRRIYSIVRYFIKGIITSNSLRLNKFMRLIYFHKEMNKGQILKDLNSI